MSEESQRTLAALDRLEAVLGEIVGAVDSLVDRISHLRAELGADRPLADLVTEDNRPLVIERLTQLLDRLGDASADLRRAEAHQLRAEGFSQNRIAATFGVSRQRAAALLAPPPHPGARAAKRPRADDD